ncbi:DUF192 domain-containing protein [Castellaniella caeni]|uniref:DUF192 domain-containing protein n=1 Tax=Castellaniella caeni TaxID=266123 RepID=UPI00083146D2|nr:DUF192 domain-containing protein [Castellaniella caeni]
MRSGREQGGCCWGGPDDVPAWGPASGPLALVVARTFGQRFWGLHRSPRWGAAPWGLLLPTCRSVHTLGLRRALDVVFLDAAGRVLRLAGGVPPNRLVGCRRAACVLELPDGYCRQAGWAAQAESAVRLWKMVS